MPVNGVQGWKDPSGSIVRRFAVAKFTNPVPDAEADLEAQIKGEAAPVSRATVQ